MFSIGYEMTTQPGGVLLQGKIRGSLLSSLADGFCDSNQVEYFPLIMSKKESNLVTSADH